MSLFIASRSIPHKDDGSRRTIADGWLRRRKPQAAVPQDCERCLVETGPGRCGGCGREREAAS